MQSGLRVVRCPSASKSASSAPARWTTGSCVRPCGGSRSGVWTGGRNASGAGGNTGAGRGRRLVSYFLTRVALIAYPIIRDPAALLGPAGPIGWGWTLLLLAAGLGIGLLLMRAAGITAFRAVAGPRSAQPALRRRSTRPQVSLRPSIRRPRSLRRTSTVPEQNSGSPGGSSSQASCSPSPAPLRRVRRHPAAASDPAPAGGPWSEALRTRYRRGRGNGDRGTGATFVRTTDHPGRDPSAEQVTRGREAGHIRATGAPFRFPAGNPGNTNHVADVGTVLGSFPGRTRRASHGRRRIAGNPARGTELQRPTRTSSSPTGRQSPTTAPAGPPSNTIQPLRPRFRPSGNAAAAPRPCCVAASGPRRRPRSPSAPTGTCCWSGARSPNSRNSSRSRWRPCGPAWTTSTPPPNDPLIHSCHRPRCRSTAAATWACRSSGHRRRRRSTLPSALRCRSSIREPASRSHGPAPVGAARRWSDLPRWEAPAHIAPEGR